MYNFENQMVSAKLDKCFVQIDNKTFSCEALNYVAERPFYFYTRGSKIIESGIKEKFTGTVSFETSDPDFKDLIKIDFSVIQTNDIGQYCVNHNIDYNGFRQIFDQIKVVRSPNSDIVFNNCWISNLMWNSSSLVFKVSFNFSGMDV